MRSTKNLCAPDARAENERVSESICEIGKGGGLSPVFAKQGPSKLAPPLNDAEHSYRVASVSINDEIGPHDADTNVAAETGPWRTYLGVVEQEPIERPDLLAIIAGNPPSGFVGEIFKNTGKVGLGVL
jgi:hypothetical protein